MTTLYDQIFDILADDYEDTKLLKKRVEEIAIEMINHIDNVIS